MNRTKKGALEQAEAEYNSSVSEYNKAKNALALQTQNAAQSREQRTLLTLPTMEPTGCWVEKRPRENT